VSEAERPQDNDVRSAETECMDISVDIMPIVAEVAGLAPSVHNTQPWLLVAVGHTLEVRADIDRQLSYLDPSSRQLHMSCGVAVEFARLAVRSLGYDAVVRLLPSADPTLLATITIGRASQPTAAERRWVEAIPRRYTDRGAYDDIALAAGVVAAASDAAADRGAWLRVLDRPGDRVAATMLLSEAGEIEAAEPRYRQELDRWRRLTQADDGIPDAATGWDRPDTVTDVPLRDFTGEATPRSPGTETPPHVERDTLLLLGSDDDTPVGWLRSGRALGLVLLVLTDAGVATQPLGPVTDVLATRTRLQHELGLVGHPQLLLRAGYGHGRPRAGRRSVDEVLTVLALA
jgi:nitroreductase